MTLLLTSQKTMLPEGSQASPLMVGIGDVVRGTGADYAPM